MRARNWLGALLAGVLLAGAAAAQDDDGVKKLTPAEELAWLLKDGPVHLKTRSWHAASKTYARAVELAPDNFEARFGLATAFARLENYRAALEHARQACALDPSHDGAKLLLGRLLLDLGKLTEARTALEELHGRVPDTPGLTRMLGRLSYREGKWEQALPLLADAAGEPGADPEVRGEYADCAYTLERWNIAMNEYNAVEQLTKNNENLEMLHAKAARRFLQARARIRTFGALESGGLVFFDQQRRVRVTRPEGRGWAFVFGENKPEALVCRLATADDEVTITVEYFGEKARVAVGRQHLPAGDPGALRKAHEVDIAMRYKKLRGWPPIPVRTDGVQAVSTALSGTPRDGEGREVVQVTLLPTQDALFRVVIVGEEKRATAERGAMADVFKTLELPK